MDSHRKLRFWLWVAVLLGLVGGLIEYWRYDRERSQDANILAAARQYGMDPSLIKAVVWRESRFNPLVRGRAGEVGLMQVGKLAGKEWAQAEGIVLFDHEDLLNPARNILAGTWYLRKMLRRSPPPIAASF